MKGLVDELDVPAVIETRCESCANCPTRKLSAREKTKSLQESFEQDVLKASVHINREEKKVEVDLPFIKEPVAYLTTKHNGPDNLYQAKRYYLAQCRKRPEVKEHLKTTVKDLADRGFMQPLSSLPEDLQKLIADAPVRHFYVWRAVVNEDSLSTPIRMVVDPSTTGLNIILAKGENMLPKIPEMLIQFRSFRYAWNTDISKMYNQLHLRPEALPYSLFLLCQIDTGQFSLCFGYFSPGA